MQNQQINKSTNQRPSLILRSLSLFLAFIILHFSFPSCVNQKEELNVFDDSSISTLTYAASQNQVTSSTYVNNYILSIDLVNADPSSQGIEQKINDFNTTNNSGVTVQEMLDFKESFVRMMTEDNYTPPQSRFFSSQNNLPKKIYNLIMTGLNDSSSYNDFEVNIANARQYANSLTNTQQRQLALAQIEQTSFLTQEFIKKYETNSQGIQVQRISVKCKWWQWACVTASTAAAVALMAASGVAIAAIILGGGVVATVAMCCICKCKCSFGGNCKK